MVWLSPIRLACRKADHFRQSCPIFTWIKWILSPILSNIYLDKMDRELEQRGLRFVRYADDCNIFVKSEKAANRVMKSISSWLERKLFLKVNTTKTKVVRPTKSNFLGFTFWKTGEHWQARRPSFITRLESFFVAGKQLLNLYR